MKQSNSNNKQNENRKIEVFNLMEGKYFLRKVLTLTHIC